MPPLSTITHEERMKRETALRLAIADSRLEGQRLDDEALAIFQQYVQGEITLVQRGQMLDQLNDRQFPRPVPVSRNGRP